MSPGGAPLLRGLLSTSALLELFGIVGEERYAIESRLRPRMVPISTDNGQSAVVRDQRPLSHKKLASCLLDGLTPTEWYRLLNGKVFFWLTEQRLETLMRAYEDTPHLVLEVDAAELLKRHGKRVLLTPMNTGCTSPMAFQRGKSTFLPPREYPFEENRRKKGGYRKAIVELTVEYGVPDIAEFTISATHREVTNRGSAL